MQRLNDFFYNANFLLKILKKFITNNEHGIRKNLKPNSCNLNFSNIPVTYFFIQLRNYLPVA